MKLRPYQEEALAAVKYAMQTEKNILLQAATGAGKTIMFASIIKDWLTNYGGMRIAVIAHREILVRQAYEKLLKVWPEGEGKIGIACSSVSSSMNLDAPCVIGSPQTMARRLNDVGEFHLAIVDECHRLPPPSKKSQYNTLISDMRNTYPDMRLLGVTATPFRLGHGYIYGSQCRRGEDNWFPDLTYSISISDLQEQGFLSPYKAKQGVAMGEALRAVSTRSGDFNLDQLESVMSKEVHIMSAVEAVQEHAADRKHIAVFATTINHAQLLKGAFLGAGIKAGVIHSEQPKHWRNHELERFANGETRVICNVGVLTEGWDFPSVDCIVLCRPTMSPALFVQMVGRGLRITEGKTDCLVLDLSDNFTRHGDPNAPTVIIGGRDAGKPKDSPLKVCPGCQEIIDAKAQECPECGYRFERPKLVEDNRKMEMVDVSFKPKAYKARVNRVLSEPYTSRKGHYLLKVMVNVTPEYSMFPHTIAHYFDIEGHASEYGMLKADRLWWQLSGGESMPATVDEAAQKFHQLKLPEFVTVTHEGKYEKIKGW